MERGRVRHQHGASVGQHGRARVQAVAAGVHSIEHGNLLDSETAPQIAAAGVTMGLGTGLLGETQTMQNQEIVIRSEVQTAEQILRSMRNVNPRLCHLEGRIGVVTPGAFGDLVVSRVNPLDDITAFADHTTAVSYVVRGGNVVVER